MFRLASLIYSMASVTLAGTFMIVALVAGYATLWPIVGAAALGAVLAVPAAWLVARAILARPGGVGQTR
jgi:hypothetical protein